MSTTTKPNNFYQEKNKFVNVVKKICVEKIDFIKFGKKQETTNLKTLIDPSSGISQFSPLIISNLDCHKLLGLSF